MTTIVIIGSVQFILISSILAIPIIVFAISLVRVRTSKGQGTWVE